MKHDIICILISLQQSVNISNHCIKKRYDEAAVRTLLDCNTRPYKDPRNG